MSVKIRLTRTGKRNAPSFRIVATQTRSKRDGKFLDIIGHYNPSEKPVKFAYDKKKYEECIKKGAKPTEAVEKLIEGTYEFKPYKPNEKKEEEAPAAVETSENDETPTEEKKEEKTE
jgi:small subunit ribosomal protein S16